MLDDRTNNWLCHELYGFDVSLQAWKAKTLGRRPEITSTQMALACSRHWARFRGILRDMYGTDEPNKDYEREWCRRQDKQLRNVGPDMGAGYWEER